MNLYRVLTLLFFCGILTYSANAQNFGGGILLGLSTSQVSGDDLGGFNKAGLLVGIFANKSITSLLNFQMEMTYIQKGSHNPKMTKDDKEDISSSYFEMPFLLQYHQSEVLKIEGGVLGGYLIDGYYNDLYGRMPNKTNPFINYDIGLLLGLDYKFSKNISLNTRISNSIFPIGSEDYNHPIYYNSSRKGKYNAVLSFALHYNF